MSKARTPVNDDAEQATLAVTIRDAQSSSDLDWLKALADKHKTQLGFVRRGELHRSIEQKEMLVIEEGGRQRGFVQFHHRRDGQTTIYNIIVASEVRGQGLGRGLIQALILACQAHGQTTIRLKCPDNLEANKFYKHVGFEWNNREEGKLRALNVWHLHIEPPCQVGSLFGQPGGQADEGD